MPRPGWSGAIRVSVSKAKRVNRPNPPKATPARREAFLRQAENAVTVSLLNGIRRFKRGIPKATLDDMYRNQDYDGLYKTLPWPVLEQAMDQGDARIQRSKIGIGQQTLNAIDANEADQATSLAYVSDRVLGKRPGKPTNAAPKGRLRRMLPDIQGEAREHIKQTVALGAAQGMTPRMVSDRIVEGLILNPRQKEALANFRQGLEDKGKLSPARIDAKVARYEQALQRQRADMIAVTETRVAAGQTELKSWQAQEQSGLIDAGAQREWSAEPDACIEICRPMSGTAIGINEMWTLPDGRVIEQCNMAHPMCRCLEILLQP